jgi:hypothetical protein
MIDKKPALIVRCLGVNDVAPEATAYPHRDITFVVTPGGRWEDLAQDNAPIAWVGHRSSHTWFICVLFEG